MVTWNCERVKSFEQERVFRNKAVPPVCMVVQGWECGKEKGWCLL